MAPTATTTRQPELVLAQEIITAAKSGDIRGALARAERGSRKYPDFQIPAAPGQPTPTFAQTAEWLRGKLQPAAPAAVAQQDQAPVAKPAPKKSTAARKATTPKAASAPKKTAMAATVAPTPETVKVETVTLRLVHNGSDPTSIYGVEKDSAAHLAIGSTKRGGLGWHFWKTGECFYLRRSGGYAPDYRAINEAIARLEAIERDGQRLYRVESAIETMVDGAPLPVRMSAAQRAEWQQAYDAARNALSWNLSMNQAVCGQCGATGLGEGTGRVSKDADGMPVMRCSTCGGFTAPEPQVAEPVEQVAPVERAVPDLSGLLALTATPAPIPESAECPACTQQVPVVDGKLGLHTGRYGNGACRGKLGVAVADVEPEPAQPAARKAGKVAVEPDVVAGDATGLVVKVALQAGLSGSSRNATATEVRQAISRKITYGRAFRGVKVETRRDKVNHRLVMTVAEGGDGYAADELADAIVAAVKSVRGVGHRIHK